MPIPWQAIGVCTKKAPFGKTFCLGKTGPGSVYNFMNGRAMGAVGLDPVLGKQVLKISTDGLKTKTKLFFFY